MSACRQTYRAVFGGLALAMVARLAGARDPLWWLYYGCNHSLRETGGWETIKFGLWRIRQTESASTHDVSSPTKGD